MECDKIKWGRGGRENKQTIISQKSSMNPQSSLSKSRKEKIHLVPKFDCISKSEIIYFSCDVA
jgi:hypothetical protein